MWHISCLTYLLTCISFDHIMVRSFHRGCCKCNLWRSNSGQNILVPLTCSLQRWPQKVSACLSFWCVYVRRILTTKGSTRAGKAKASGLGGGLNAKWGSSNRKKHKLQTRINTISMNLLTVSPAQGGLRKLRAMLLQMPLPLGQGKQSGKLF